MNRKTHQVLERGGFFSLKSPELVKEVLDNFRLERNELFPVFYRNAMEKQAILEFKGNKARARNFSGFITFPGETVEIYPRAFQMKHDILLTRGDEKIIIDTKYKIRTDRNTKNRGISQADMYQLVSYGFKRGCRRLILLYPAMGGAVLREPDIFTIPSGFPGMADMKITAAEIPIISTQGFYRLEETLKNRLQEILSSS